MPACAIGSVWGAGTWADTTWECGSWGGALVVPDVVKARRILALAASLAVAVEAQAVSGAEFVDGRAASVARSVDGLALSGAEFVDAVNLSIARNVQVR